MRVDELQPPLDQRSINSGERRAEVEPEQGIGANPVSSAIRGHREEGTMADIQEYSDAKAHETSVDILASRLDLRAPPVDHRDPVRLIVVETRQQPPTTSTFNTGVERRARGR